MANEIEKLNGIALTSIEKVNGKTDDNIQAFNAFEFTGVIPYGGISWATGDTHSSRAGSAYTGKLSDGIMPGGYD